MLIVTLAGASARVCECSDAVSTTGRSSNNTDELFFSPLLLWARTSTGRNSRPAVNTARRRGIGRMGAPLGGIEQNQRGAAPLMPPVGSNGWRLSEITFAKLPAGSADEYNGAPDGRNRPPSTPPARPPAPAAVSRDCAPDPGAGQPR